MFCKHCKNTCLVEVNMKQVSAKMVKSVSNMKVVVK